MSQRYKGNDVNLLFVDTQDFAKINKKSPTYK